MSLIRASKLKVLSIRTRAQIIYFEFELNSIHCHSYCGRNLKLLCENVILNTKINKECNEELELNVGNLP